MLDNDREKLLLGWGTLCVLEVYLLWVTFTLRAEAAPAAPAARTASVTLPGYAVGEFQEPPVRILTVIAGKERITLHHLLGLLPPIEVAIEDLRLVNPRAPHTKLGTRVGMNAKRVASSMPRNSRFLPSAPRVACAAFTSYILVKSGGKRHSYAVNTAYPQLRKRGGKIVAARVSTRYVGYYKWYKPGDFLFFHKRGNRLGHQEIYVGGGLTAGTSSSMLRVGIRRVGNRGYAAMTVLRL